MSEALLLVGLAATFASIAFGATVVVSSVSDRKRALRLLQAQVGQSANLREQQMSRSLVQRTLLPGLGRLASLAKKLTPASSRETIAKKLELAGLSGSWDADKVAGSKAIAAIAGFCSSLLFTNALGASGGMKLLLIGVFTAAGFILPSALLSGRVQSRQGQIRKSLPDTMDLLTISVEAGLGFDAALVQVVHHVPGPLAQEFSRVLQEVRLGRSRSEAFRQLGQRTNVAEFKSFVVAIIQAEQFGVSISGVLRAQSTELRNKRRQRAEEAAMKIPTKILFPLIFCVLPVLFMVVLGPGIIQIIEGIIGGP